MNVFLASRRGKTGVVSDLWIYISLFKPKIIALLSITAITSAVVAAGGTVQWSRLDVLFAAGVLAAAGSACLNNYFDRDVDNTMNRTRTRPLPSGKAGAAKTLFLGLLLIALAVFLVSRLSYWAAVYMMAGAFVYVVVYTVWLKRRSWLNIVVGGTAGSFAVLTGWASMDPTLTLTAIAMAAVVFLWTPHHFWSFALVYKEDYGRARLPMLPVLVSDANAAGWILFSTVPLVLATLVPYVFGNLGSVYLVCAILAGGLLLVSALVLQRHPTKEVAWHNFKVSGLYLAFLFAGMLVDVVTRVS